MNSEDPASIGSSDPSGNSNSGMSELPGLPMNSKERLVLRVEQGWLAEFPGRAPLRAGLGIVRSASSDSGEVDEFPGRPLLRAGLGIVRSAASDSGEVDKSEGGAPPPIIALAWQIR